MIGGLGREALHLVGAIERRQRRRGRRGSPRLMMDRMVEPTQRDSTRHYCHAADAQIDFTRWAIARWRELAMAFSELDDLLWLELAT